MRRLLVALVLVYGTAFAQPVPGAMVEEPKMTAGASGTVWLPSGDADDFADESIGLRAHFAYRLKEFLAIVTSFDYVFVNEQGDTDIAYYTFAAGVRLIKSRPGQIEPYGEFLLGYHALDGEGIDDSGIGFRLGGGILYPLSDKISMNASLGYSAASIDVGPVKINVDALILEVGVGARF